MWLITVAVMVVACSEDEGAPVTPSFPEEEQILSVKAGESVDLVFEASMDWKLYSSTLWCRFSNGMTSISGQAGKQTVQVSVNEEMLSYGEMQAEITLKQGDMEKVIAKLTRQGEMLLAVGEGGEIFTEETPLLLNFSRTSTTLSFTENFTLNFPWEFDQASLPEWLAVKNPPVKGGIHQKAELTMEITDDYLANEWTGNLRFKMQGEEGYVDVPVKYTGLPAGELVVRGISTKWNWNVSIDGQQYWTNGTTEGDDEPEKYFFPLSFRVLAKNNDYVVKSVFQDGKWASIDGVDDAEAFFDIKDDTHGNLELCNLEENTSTKRKGYILVFPKDKYDELSHGGTWPDKNILLNATETGLSEDLNDEYIVMVFEQEGASVSVGLPEVWLISGDNKTQLNVAQGFGENATQDLKDKFNEGGDIYLQDKSQIYNLEVESGAQLDIKPLLKNDWGDIFLEKCLFLDEKGVLLSDEPVHSITGDSPSERCLHFTCNQSVVILFQGEYSMTYKVLIITLKNK